jgi:hypothetical protein
MATTSVVCPYRCARRILHAFSRVDLTAFSLRLLRLSRLGRIYSMLRATWALKAWSRSIVIGRIVAARAGTG